MARATRWHLSEVLYRNKYLYARFLSCDMWWLYFTEDWYRVPICADQFSIEFKNYDPLLWKPLLLLIV